MRAEDVKPEWVKAARDGWWSTKEGSEKAMAAALAAVIPLIQKEEREACAGIAAEHLARIVGHNPDVQRADLVAQGYGNAAMNIECAIRARGEP